MRFIYGLLGIVVGILVLKYSPSIYKFFGKDPDAEKYFGNAGTFKFIRLFGLGVVIFSLMYLLGIV